MPPCKSNENLTILKALQKGAVMYRLGLMATTLAADSDAGAGAAGSAAGHLLIDLAAILAVAAVTTVVFKKIRQPVVLGYLLAGLIVGPHLPIPIFASEETAHELSELGVILLMFRWGWSSACAS